MSTEFNPNYKRSEVGFIPKDWKITPISSLLEINCPITYGVVQPGKNDKGGVLFIRGGDVYDGKIDIANLRRISHSISKAYRRTLLRGGEILISLVGFPGESAIVPKALAGSNIARQVALVRLANESGGDPEYICHFLRSPMGKSILLKEAFGSAQQVINLRDINKLQLPLPCTMAEQRAIATALSDMDALISGLDQLIAKKRDIKQAAMQKLLTGQARLPGFSGEWELTRMGALGATYGGLTGKTKGDFGHGHARYIPFMNVMTDTIIDVSWFESVNVALGEVQNQAKKGDLFFNGSSETPEEVGFCSVLLEDIPNLYLNSFCFGFRFSEAANVNGRFFAYWFRSSAGRSAMSVLAQGATRYNIAKSAFMKLAIPLPSLEEQAAIAAALSDMDAELAAVEARRDKSKQLKQGMMQELLTGRIRLV